MKIDISEGPDYSVCISDDWDVEEKFERLGGHFKRLGGVFNTLAATAGPQGMSESAYEGLDWCLDQLLYYSVEFVYTWGCDQKAFAGKTGDYAQSVKLGYYVFAGVMSNIIKPADGFLTAALYDTVFKTGRAFLSVMLRFAGIKKAVNIKEIDIVNDVLYDETFAYRIGEILSIESLNWMDLSQYGNYQEEDVVKYSVGAIKVGMGLRP